MNVDQRKALIDAMLALGTIARAMPLGELYEAIERDEKAERTRDGRWTQSLIHSMRWLTDVSGELERVRADSFTGAKAVQCQAGKRGPGAHIHQCQEVLINDADHIGQHICTCGHTWVAAPPAEKPTPVPSNPNHCSSYVPGEGHIHNCVIPPGHVGKAHRCKCGEEWSGGRPLAVVDPRSDVPDDWFMPGTN